MGRVSWSDEAAADLDSIDPAVRDQLRRNAEKILHLIPPGTDPADEGACSGIMWHRGDGHGRFTMQPEGPQDYFLVYKRREPASGSEDPEEDPDFEVLAVCSIRQVACMWVQMTRTPAESRDRSQAAAVADLGYAHVFPHQAAPT
jgi:hypothetical protein